MAEAAAKKPRAKKAPVEAPTTVVGYKGFDATLSCRGYQFAIGDTFTHAGKVEACSSGFHFCENPLDVWGYYPPDGTNRFARVHGGGDLARHTGDSKVAAGTLMVETEVNLGEMIRAGVKFEIEAAQVKGEISGGDSARNASGGDYARNASSGNYATNASSGHYARNASGGDSARNASGGNYATNVSSGNYATNASGGDSARNVSGGHYARNASSGNSATNASGGDSATNVSGGDSARNASGGDSATNVSGGDYARNVSSGNSARNEAGGRKSVIAAAGLNSLGKGVIGTAIAQPYEGAAGQIRFAIGVIGEDGLEPDVWYKAVAGKLVAA